MALCCLAGAAWTNGAEVLALSAGPLTRKINIGPEGVRTVSIRIGGKREVSCGAAEEVLFTRWTAVPNRRPRGLKAGEGGEISATEAQRAGTDQLLLQDATAAARETGVEWLEETRLTSGSYREVEVVRNAEESLLRLKGMQPEVVLHYQRWPGTPAIRKWVELKNSGTQWLKVGNMTLESLQFDCRLPLRTELTPSERGAVASVVGFERSDGKAGLITGSEIPSALRSMGRRGEMGYTQELFEWVLGPGESFTSEPVFLYAFEGPAIRMRDSVSKPLDRAVEGPFKDFLRGRLGVGVRPSGAHPAPLWCTWTNFGPRIDDGIVRKMAKLAAAAGFKTLQLDDGWQRGRLGTEPDRQRFPDMRATSEFVRSAGLGLGLWVSCFRDRESPDWRDVPGAGIRPAAKRLDGYAMSFTSPWRGYYAKDLARLAREFGVTYFKQDFTNIRFGDIAEGHEGRTRKESLLRGLRGLLEAQRELRRLAPEVWNEITHEIYWGTPGVPADLAALKAAALYHIPPNDYSGAGPPGRGYSPTWDSSAEKLRAGLVQGCYNARQRYYEHRGLPLEAIEYYAAATVSHNGSLTPELQDRQVASWLMGSSTVWAGDLNSLSEAQIKRYAERFAIVDDLERRYSIFGRFQYSGVPAPTDDGWHWWGKLDDHGRGAVVVIRGRGGDESRKVYVPWVRPEQQYQVTARLSGTRIGIWKGSRLRDEGVPLALAPMGQEILELDVATVK